MLRQRLFTTKCICGEVLEAQSKEGLSGILRTHVLFEHGRRNQIADEARPVLEVVGQ
ncbi:MAG: hypothetical protein WD646_14175 [Actinomycetota bacterium]